MASHTDGCHVGELHLLWDRLTSRRLCGCGVEVAACPFWSAVWADVRGTASITDPAEACNLWSTVVRIRKTFLGRVNDQDVIRFRMLMDAVYRSIARLSGASVIVDTSKHPGYFKTVVGGSVPIRLIHLARDPRALAYSWATPKPDPDQPGGAMRLRRPEVVAAEWLGLNLLSTALGRSHDAYSRVKYETLATEGLEASVDLPTDLMARPDRPVARERLDDLADQRTGHTVAGNPLRLATTDEIRLDDRWVMGQSTTDRLIVTALTAPLLPAFGYRLAV